MYIYIYSCEHRERENRLVEDNAGNVLIPGCRAFIVVRPSASRLRERMSLQFLHASEVYQEGHRPPALSVARHRSHQHPRPLTYVVRLSQGLWCHFARQVAPRGDRIYPTFPGPGGLCMQQCPHYFIAKTNSAYLKYSAVDTAPINFNNNVTLISHYMRRCSDFD